MSTNKKSSGLGLTEILILILLWWAVLYILFDWQLSIRVERADPNADIIESLKDSAIKSFTVTDHDYVEDENIIDEIINSE